MLGGPVVLLKITAEGMSLVAPGGPLGPGCVPGAGLTLPAGKGGQDFDGLRVCAESVRPMLPLGGEGLTITLAPTGEIDWQTVVSAMDALRVDRRGAPLFPFVLFAVPQ